jgi:hypothetical protein
MSTLKQLRAERESAGSEYTKAIEILRAGWMTEDGSTNTPEGVFAFLCLDSLPERALIRSTLVQVAKIEECGWARKMVAALDELDGRSGDQD